METPKRSWKDALWLVAKGMAMGTANKIPGVSGGIVALAAGFYEELIYSFSKFDAKAFDLLRKGKFKKMYGHVNGSFLFLLFTGVGLSFFSVSLVLDYFLQQHETQVLGLFFGMIVASLYSIWQSIRPFTATAYMATLAGTLLGIALMYINPGQENDHLGFVFLCGMLSIAGMTLPGLSGSFLLLVIGNYRLLLVDAVNAIYYTLTEISTGDVQFIHDTERMRLLYVMCSFTLGSGAGLVLFSKLLDYLLKHFKTITIAVLVGFIFGSLGSVWPWKSQQILEDITPAAWHLGYLPNTFNFPEVVTIISIGMGIFTVRTLERYGKKDRS